MRPPGRFTGHQLNRSDRKRLRRVAARRAGLPRLREVIHEHIDGNIGRSEGPDQLQPAEPVARRLDLRNHSCRDAVLGGGECCPVLLRFAGWERQFQYRFQAMSQDGDLEAKVA
jgi:hypothetical protein